MKTIFTTSDVAKLCGVAPRIVAKWFDSGRLRGYRIPGSQDRRIPVEHLLRFLREQGMPIPDEINPNKVNDNVTICSQSLGTVEKTGRGFGVIKFRDAYNAECSVQCSSASDDTERGMEQPGSSFLWIGPDNADPRIMASQAAEHGVETAETCGWIPYPIPEAVLLTTRMHLNREQVTDLIVVLREWLQTGVLVGQKGGSDG